jgi:glycopeptide antibiotics resistance protein
VTISLTAEFLQLFASGRVSSRADVAAQTTGCVLGIMAWVAAGPEVTAWLRTASTRARAERLAKALVGYAAAWIFINLAPFDITLQLDELAQRVRAGLITIVPFGSGQPTSRLVWDAAAAMMSAVPLGMIGLVQWTSMPTRRSAGLAFRIGAALVASMEVAQIFLRSHAADVTDIIFGWLGVALGVAVGLRIARRTTSEVSAPPLTSAWPLTALALWFAVLGAYHWMPYDLALNEALIRAKLAKMSLIPFAGLRFGSDLNAFNDILLKLSLSMPLGVIGSFVLRPLSSMPGVLTASWLAVAVASFGAIETGQLFVPSRTPDPSDVYLGVMGSCVGLALGRWLQAARTT